MLSSFSFVMYTNGFVNDFTYVCTLLVVLMVTHYIASPLATCRGEGGGA